ncbi:MAG: hypothetical protein H5U03_10280, partial [Clostridia bacterium]|nr:hypothetical protein [Clostridia bacterium]
AAALYAILFAGEITGPAEFGGGMLYMEPPYNKRFVERELDLLILPYDKARALRRISPNTLVDVNDLVQVGGERWLYVTVPVYDTPVDIKGWVREADTVSFTKDKEKKSRAT